MLAWTWPRRWAEPPASTRRDLVYTPGILSSFPALLGCILSSNPAVDRHLWCIFIHKTGILSTHTALYLQIPCWETKRLGPLRAVVESIVPLQKRARSCWSKRPWRCRGNNGNWGCHWIRQQFTPVARSSCNFVGELIESLIFAVVYHAFAFKRANFRSFNTLTRMCSCTDFLILWSIISDGLSCTF